MTKRVVITFGNGWYLNWKKRLLDSLEQFDVDAIAWGEEYPPGSPAHAEVPYAFKVYAFADAAERGYTSILWCDAAIIAQRDPKTVFELIEQQGHVFFKNWYNCGEWCTDAALKKHGLSRDAAMHIPDFTACCMGLDLTHGCSREFLRQWTEAAKDGVSFIGSPTNESGECSADNRCRGHRHDQVIASIIAHRMGMPLTPWLPLFSYHDYVGFNGDVVMVNDRRR